jgi:hypothetical protein
MSTSTARRPLPALGFLLALTILTSIVWWRVLHRTDSTAATKPTPKPQQTSCGVTAALPAPKTISVQVLNGSGRDGLATQLTDQLKALGFATGTPDNSPTQVAGVAEIRYGTAGKGGATLLGYYLPGAKLVTASRPDGRVDVVLGKTYSKLATPAAVNKAIASAKKPC